MTCSCSWTSWRRMTWRMPKQSLEVWGTKLPALQVAHAYWVAKLKGRGFRALVAHYHRVPPPGWREPRVTTHAFEFVVGPPRPAERRAAIASQRRKVARRSGRGNPVMSLLEGQPIKHDHRSGVACLAC